MLQHIFQGIDSMCCTDPQSFLDILPPDFSFLAEEFDDSQESIVQIGEGIFNKLEFRWRFGTCPIDVGQGYFECAFCTRKNGSHTGIFVRSENLAYTSPVTFN